jgi:endoglucanase
VYLLFNQAATARPNLAQGAGLGVNRTGWQTEIERYLDQAIGGKGQAYYTKGGFPPKAVQFMG